MRKRREITSDYFTNKYVDNKNNEHYDIYLFLEKTAQGKNSQLALQNEYEKKIFAFLHHFWWQYKNIRGLILNLPTDLYEKILKSEPSKIVEDFKSVFTSYLEVVRIKIPITDDCDLQELHENKNHGDLDSDSLVFAMMHYLRFAKPDEHFVFCKGYLLRYGETDEFGEDIKDKYELL